jgi:hypothetical protein
MSRDEIADEIDEVDDDRLTSADLYVTQVSGRKLPKAGQAMAKYYGVGEELFDIRKFARADIPHNMTKGTPLTPLEDRYLVEDVPFWYVPVYELGRALGAEGKALKKMIAWAGEKKHCDYFETGLTLKELELEGLSKNEIIAELEGISAY